jgi:hypothetical protein
MSAPGKEDSTVPQCKGRKDLFSSALFSVVVVLVDGVGSTSALSAVTFSCVVGAAKDGGRSD